MPSRSSSDPFAGNSALPTTVDETETLPLKGESRPLRSQRALPPSRRSAPDSTSPSSSTHKRRSSDRSGRRTRSDASVGSIDSNISGPLDDIGEFEVNLQDATGLHITTGGTTSADQDDAGLARARDRLLARKAPPRSQSESVAGDRRRVRSSRATDDEPISNESQRSQRSIRSRRKPTRTKSTSDDSQSQASVQSRGRPSKSGGHRKGSSRSRSKGAKKRSGSRLAQIPTTITQQDTPKDSTTSHDSKSTSNQHNTVNTTSTRVRRKTSSGTGPAKSLAGLSMLDDMNPRSKRGPRDARSVGPEMQSPTRLSTSILPQRKVLRTASQDGISTLADFLKKADSSSKSSNRMSSSRSVGAAPDMRPSKSAGSSSRPTRRRLKKSNKSDEESEEASVSIRKGKKSTITSSGSGGGGGGGGASKRLMMSGHSSLGSGLDLQMASNDLFGSKKRGKKPSSKHSRSSNDDGLDEGSLHVSDIFAKKKPSTDSGNNSAGAGRLARSLGDIAFKASGIGSLLSFQKEAKRRGSGFGGASTTSISMDGLNDDFQEDIFSHYIWSTSRQPRGNIQDERKLLNETLRQGAFLAAYEAYVGN